MMARDLIFFILVDHIWNISRLSSVIFGQMISDKRFFLDTLIYRNWYDGLARNLFLPTKERVNQLIRKDDFPQRIGEVLIDFFSKDLTHVIIEYLPRLYELPVQKTAKANQSKHFLMRWYHPKVQESNYFSRIEQSFFRSWIHWYIQYVPEGNISIRELLIESQHHFKDFKGQVTLGRRNCLYAFEDWEFGRSDSKRAWRIFDVKNSNKKFNLFRTCEALSLRFGDDENAVEIWTGSRMSDLFGYLHGGEAMRSNEILKIARNKVAFTLANIAKGQEHIKGQKVMLETLMNKSHMIQLWAGCSKDGNQDQEEVDQGSLDCLVSISQESKQISKIVNRQVNLFRAGL